MQLKLMRYLPLIVTTMAIQIGFAQKPCVNSDLIGLYGFSANGRIFLPADTPITGPFARAGYASVDGNGKLLITSTASYNGNIFTETFDGTYQVRPDCTFTYIANLGQPINFPVEFTGIIYEGGKRADFLLVNPQGSTINATIVRQNKVGCSNADMTGTYAFFASGSILGLSDYVVRVGLLTASANSSVFATARNEPGGTLKASSTVSYGGAIRTEDFTGSYTVNTNCTIAMQLSPDGGVTNIKADGVFVNSTRDVLFVVTAPGTAVTGSFKRQ